MDCLKSRLCIYVRKMSFASSTILDRLSLVRMCYVSLLFVATRQNAAVQMWNIFLLESNSTGILLAATSMERFANLSCRVRARLLIVGDKGEMFENP